MDFEKDNPLTSNEVKKRLKVMIQLAHDNTAALDSFMHLPREKKICGKKRDGTIMTVLDYATNEHSMTTYLDNFPEDSFDGEEVHMIRENARFTMLEDPVDATWHAILFDVRTPEKHCWATYMSALLAFGRPVAFTLGIPHRKEVFWGSIYEGVFLNGNRLEARQGKLIIHEDRRFNDETVANMLGCEDLHIAGMAAWLIASGFTLGGICPFHLPHESSCIAAAAVSAGAKVSNRYGSPFQPYNERDGLIWIFDHNVAKDLVLF